MNNRLKQFLAAENITQAQFADTLEVVRASVSHVLSGRNNPGYDFIKAIMLKYPTLNMEWLIFGKGKMYKEQVETESPSSVRPVQEEEMLLFDDIQEEEFETNTSNNQQQSVVTQRKVNKIIILYDDGTYQEM